VGHVLSKISVPSVAICNLGRMLVQFASASAIRIALSAGVATPQPAIGLQAVAQQCAAGMSAEPAGDSRGPAARQVQMPTRDFAGPGIGWG
jgi:hypothetical protein